MLDGIRHETVNAKIRWNKTQLLARRRKKQFFTVDGREYNSFEHEQNNSNVTKLARTRQNAINSVHLSSGKMKL